MANRPRALVREMGLRDGLQSIRTIMPTATKLDWIAREAACGVPEIEVASFVPARLLPQMADAAQVVPGARKVPELMVSVLVPNMRGAQDAIAAGAMKLNYVMSVSESHNMANVRRPVSESLADFGRIVEFCRGLDPTRRPIVAGGLATAFGCTIEGPIREERSRELAAQLVELGADEIIVADTVGYGNPAAVRRIFAGVLAEAGELPVAAHFHDTRGVGLANVVAALDEGIVRFDASLGGLGGCPYAPGASGNIVMEDLVFLLETMGYATGVDLTKLIEVRKVVQASLADEQKQFHGALSQAGLPKNYAHV
ncbi:MAG: hydroxymethylglutaryl-CoA lyase [Usitatibacter sp.]